MSDELKSSEQWQAEDDMEIVDPDGWDRINFIESWAELITHEEYVRRAGRSTIKPKDKPKSFEEEHPLDWQVYQVIEWAEDVKGLDPIGSSDILSDLATVARHRFALYGKESPEIVFGAFWDQFKSIYYPTREASQGI